MVSPKIEVKTGHPLEAPDEHSMNVDMILGKMSSTRRRNRNEVTKEVNLVMKTKEDYAVMTGINTVINLDMNNRVVLGFDNVNQI